jgi:VIT1/CCC1 family predicted Fe2+/Mn2+ transporter
LLDPIDRVSEILFGLIMAVTVVGSLSIATAGREEVRTVLAGALGCNLAWGLVDAFMYLVRALTERTRNAVLAKQIASTDVDAGRRLIAAALPDHVASITGPQELDAMRRRLVDSAGSARAGLVWEDYLAAARVFLLVVVATLPVVVPFMLAKDVTSAMRLSQAVTLVMLFVGGLVLGRHAGYHRPARTGLTMAVLGVVLIGAVKALGG